MPSPMRIFSHSLAFGLFIASSVSSSQLKSRLSRSNVTYQEPGICETVPGVKSYSGYVTLPSTIYQNYTQNIFFWFFESRNDPATDPVTVWLQGGPGAPSIDQALGENGPCIVQDDSNSTVLNPWSWNNISNILYIDQPVLSGFSYTEALAGAQDMTTGEIYIGSDNPGSLNYTGVYSNQDPSQVVPTTAVAAEAIYDFLHAWMEEFKQYRRDKIHIWTQSYGGHYAPAIANLLQTRSTAQFHSDGTIPIGVESVGIINGFIDFLVQGEFYGSFAINNTYGIQAYPESVADEVLANFTKPGGCKDQILECRAVTPNKYRDQLGNNDTVNEICGGAIEYCWTYAYLAYEELSGRDYEDIASPFPVPLLPESPYAYGYLAQKWVMDALGVKVNYTQSSSPLSNTFANNGDYVFGGFSEDIGSLLNAGVKVALWNGDRDYRCNWVGGEALSLSIEYDSSDAFAAAGYTDLKTNSNYVGGQVRQYGNFSYTRVYEAGHEVPYYQPETSYRIFERTLAGNDLATGKVPTGRDYTTVGPTSVFNITNAMPTLLAAQCYILETPLDVRCEPWQIAALEAGTADVVNDIVVGNLTDNNGSSA